MFFTSCPLHEIVSQGGLYMWTNVSNVFNFHLEQKAVKLCWALPSGASLKVPTCLLCRCFLWNGDALTKWGSWWYKLCWEIVMSKLVDGILLPFLPILILIFLGTGTVYAQWSAVDSWASHLHPVDRHWSKSNNLTRTFMVATSRIYMNYTFEFLNGVTNKGPVTQIDGVYIYIYNICITYVYSHAQLVTV